MFYKQIEKYLLLNTVNFLCIVVCVFASHNLFIFDMQAETLALSLLSHELQELGVLSKPEEFTPIVELQYYCQVSLKIIVKNQRSCKMS